ncbi:MAG: hypothetical protein PVJ76_02635 [Gemmatimonadota bacterium]|jgi:hypothetical protein
MIRPYLLSAAIFLSLLGMPATTLSGQDTLSSPPPQPLQVVDPVDLVFEREAFVYPRYDRRNPFLPLVAGDDQGPRFEEIELTGILFSGDPDRSIAMFRIRTGESQSQGERGTGGRSYGVRRGESLGNVRILEIQPTRVVVLVEEFGLTEQRVLELPRPGEGGL